MTLTYNRMANKTAVCCGAKIDRTSASEEETHCNDSYKSSAQCTNQDDEDE